MPLLPLLVASAFCAHSFLKLTRCAEIERAVKILEQNELASQAGKGAFTLQEADASSTMIDAPMLLQAQAIISKAQQARLEIRWSRQALL
jgi:citrate lyase beta subunit